MQNLCDCTLMKLKIIPVLTKNFQWGVGTTSQFKNKNLGNGPVMVQHPPPPKKNNFLFKLRLWVWTSMCDGIRILFKLVNESRTGQMWSELHVKQMANLVENRRWSRAGGAVRVLSSGAHAQRSPTPLRARAAPPRDGARAPPPRPPRTTRPHALRQLRIRPRRRTCRLSAARPQWHTRSHPPNWIEQMYSIE